MAAKKQTAMEFTRAFLKRKRGATFAEIRDAAQKKGLKIYPIVYGRAQSLEGIVKTAAYGTSKKSKKKKAAARSGRGPGRPRKQASTLDSIDGIIEAMRQSSQEIERYREALQRIRDVIDEVLD